MKNESLWCSAGRHPKNIHDILICLAIKRHFGKSLRKNIGLLRLLKKRGAIDVEIPCFKTLDNCQRSRGIKPYLSKLIKLTSNPLKLLEHFFFTDSTGGSTTCYSAWYDICTRKSSKKCRHLIIHVTTGTRLKNVAIFMDVRAENWGILRHQGNIPLKLQKALKLRSGMGILHISQEKTRVL